MRYVLITVIYIFAATFSTASFIVLGAAAADIGSPIGNRLSEISAAATIQFVFSFSGSLYLATRNRSGVAALLGMLQFILPTILFFLWAALIT